ncbi:OFA family MFS transporter [soil metagenome]
MNILASERAVAQPGFNRWLIPPAALAVHLCIGQVYALSMFSEPLTRIIGVTVSAPEDWSLRALAPLFVVAISVLGLSTTIAGNWIDRQGPRAVMFLAACCFSGGLLVAALGIFTHQLWLLYLGYGGLGGVGLGLGYVAPVSTLIRWFPDRRGLASGLAIMGFGGGAMIAAPLSRDLMDFFRSPTSSGIGETLIAMAIVYFISMSIGAFTIRVPSPGWRPEGMVQDDGAPDAIVAGRGAQQTVGGRQALKTPQFYLLWVLLCMNVTSGIELLAHAPDKLLDTFPGVITTAAAAGFVGLLGLFNMSGRLIWSASSDFLGRQHTYTVLLFFGAVFYAGISAIGQTSVTLFVVLYALAISIYGGCFAMIPAYITDLFGSRNLTCIHGRLLSAWSVGVILSSLISSLRAYQIGLGVPSSEVDDKMLYLAGVLLLVGLVCNLLIRPVSSRHHTPAAAFGQAEDAKKAERSLTEQGR